MLLVNSRRASSMVRIFFTWKSGSAPARPQFSTPSNRWTASEHRSSSWNRAVLVGPHDAAHAAGEVLDAEHRVLAADVAALVGGADVEVR